MDKSIVRVELLEENVTTVVTTTGRSEVGFWKVMPVFKTVCWYIYKWSLNVLMIFRPIESDQPNRWAGKSYC